VGKEMRLTGAEILIECLKEQGVDTVFGIPGGTVLNIFDELYKHKDRVKNILTSHEQGAAHAADGYARATGKVGVCIATSGPGATNTVTGIATAYMDSIPLVVITGNVAVPLLGKDSFQEIDIAGVTMPITKHNFIVKDVRDLAETIRRAFYIAQEGRPGPVLIDIPKDVTALSADYTPEKPRKIERVAEATAADLETAIEMIEAAKRPFIYSGGGVVFSDATGELTEFARKISSPVAASMMGLGGFPGNDELFTGMIGMHGTKASNIAVTKCDLLIAVGVRFSDRVISKADRFAPSAKIIQIDIDPAEINKNVKTHHHIIGDVKTVLTQLNKRLKQKERGVWFNEVMKIKQEHPLKYKQDDVLRPQYIIERIYELTNGDALIATEVGQNQIWAAQFYKYTKPRTFISSCGLGTMGYGTGAAIGAQVGKPDKTVFNIAGDGSFRMNCNELATAVYYKLPIIIAVMNNGTLGMVRQWQRLFYEERFSETTLDRGPDFVKLAEAYGATGYRVIEKSDVDEVLKKALAAKGPVVIDFILDIDEKVLPMVPPGDALDKLITE
jgi:acetolactate synthase-1/2/3 large subunit